jgi:hypothetical protein
MYKAAIANYDAQIWDQTPDGVCRRPRAARTLFICGSNRYRRTNAKAQTEGFIQLLFRLIS